MNKSKLYERNIAEFYQSQGLFLRWRHDGVDRGKIMAAETLILNNVFV